MENKPYLIASNERFIRWQGVLREQVTFLNNLLLTLSIAILGFLITTLNNQFFNPIGWKKAFFSFGFILIILSALTGLFASISRLRDFRLTLMKIKNSLTDKNLDESNNLKQWMGIYGKLTWTLLLLQFVTFLFALIVLVISFFSIYSTKLL
ncbi:hypothetical protein [Ferruginibacter sp. SUN106]|uniref:hypothetical protein n=1 Tax=Ferruginibacter sp. SUN106 TaxID=2978348 RepID=UPI003D36B189